MISITVAFALGAMFGLITTALAVAASKEKRDGE